MLKRRLTALIATLALLGGGAPAALPARADTPTHQPSYSGDCAHHPAGENCIEFSDGYVWLIQDSIVDWGSNHGTLQMAYGRTANYAHALGTDMVWTLAK
jgi:hypothetical protein